MSRYPQGVFRSLTNWYRRTDFLTVLQSQNGTTFVCLVGFVSMYCSFPDKVECSCYFHLCLPCNITMGYWNADLGTNYCAYHGPLLRHSRWDDSSIDKQAGSSEVCAWYMTLATVTLTFFSVIAELVVGFMVPGMFSSPCLDWIPHSLWHIGRPIAMMLCVLSKFLTSTSNLCLGSRLVNWILSCLFFNIEIPLPDIWIHYRNAGSLWSLS